LDDEVPHAQRAAEILNGAGHACELFYSSRGFISRFFHDSYDLLLLDWMMPELSGIEVLRQIRSTGPGDLPVLMLTSRSRDADIVEGLNSGADDYVVKPVQEGVLLARVNALLRRLRSNVEDGPEPAAFGRYLFDPRACTVAYDAKSIVLTNREFQLAYLLFQHPDRAFSRQYLIERLWGTVPDVQTRTLDTHVARIRSKLQLRPDRGFKLTTLYGYGYRLEPVEKRNADAC